MFPQIPHRNPPIACQYFIGLENQTLLPFDIVISFVRVFNTQRYIERNGNAIYYLKIKLVNAFCVLSCLGWERIFAIDRFLRSSRQRGAKSRKGIPWAFGFTAWPLSVAVINPGVIFAGKHPSVNALFGALSRDITSRFSRCRFTPCSSCSASESLLPFLPFPPLPFPPPPRLRVFLYSYLKLDSPLPPYPIFIERNCCVATALMRELRAFALIEHGY